jgi:hypothetical protein
MPIWNIFQLCLFGIFHKYVYLAYSGKARKRPSLDSHAAHYSAALEPLAWPVDSKSLVMLFTGTVSITTSGTACRARSLRFAHVEMLNSQKSTLERRLR